MNLKTFRTKRAARIDTFLDRLVEHVGKTFPSMKEAEGATRQAARDVFDVLENELQKFRQGARIQVISVAYPSEVHEAVVSAISPVVEKNGMVRLEGTLTPHPHLMPGMTAIVSR